MTLKLNMSTFHNVCFLLRTIWNTFSSVRYSGAHLNCRQYVQFFKYGTCTHYPSQPPELVSLNNMLLRPFPYQ